MIIERHDWRCDQCGKQGEIITSQTTTIDDFTSMVFRDHDLNSKDCHPKFLHIWVKNGVKWAWQIQRPEVHV